MDVYVNINTYVYIYIILFHFNTILVDRGDEVLGFSSYGKPGMLEGIANDNRLFSKQMVQTISSQSCVFPIVFHVSCYIPVKPL